MKNDEAARTAGSVLRRLIKENYPNRREFAFAFGISERTVARYVNEGINKITTLQELADFFHLNVREFLG